MATSLPATHDIYGATRLSADEFRLFRLERPSYDTLVQLKVEPQLDTKALVKCELVTFSMAERAALPEYVAVSYRWGTEDEVLPIEINGHTFTVRRNMLLFLMQMVLETSRKWFFVDAICINQNDAAEKASQVNMMRAVYKNAERVLVWIGWVSKEALREEQSEDDDEDTAALRMMARDRYWTRLWIVQEILLAKQLEVRLGAKSVKWWNIVTGKNKGMLAVDPHDQPQRPPVENV
jgi:hypothetical protein